MKKQNRTVARVLGDRAAGPYLAGVVVSSFGTSALGTVAGVWVKDLSGSNTLAALCTLAMWLPTLAGPALGLLADRVRRRPLLIATDLALAAALLTLFAVRSPDRVWLLFTVLLVYGAVLAVQDPAESALLASVVDGELLGDLNGLRTTAAEGVRLLAPAVGAGLYAAYGGPAVAGVDAASCAVAAAVWLLVRVAKEPPRPTADGTWREATAQGARQLWGHPRLRPLVLAGGATMLLAGVNAATTYAVVDALGRSPAFVGVLSTAQGAGSAVAGLLSGPALRRLGALRLAAAGIAVAALCVAARAVPYDVVTVACSAGVGLGLPCVLVAAFTEVQRETPVELLGRVSATAGTVVNAPTVLGLGGGAWLVAVVDQRLLSVATGALLLTVAAALTRPPATAARTTSGEPPRTAAPPSARTGAGPPATAPPGEPRSPAAGWPSAHPARRASRTADRSSSDANPA
ncbi:MFS transporter [Streptomyces mangrovisoli]|uniref:MFS transporter n=1 Tax=Streptomyces mangrovisoli TaxID=1428628 RepID=A0A1J4NLB0_9ACTN|nr:MFS transporter [Streptomyces mangrovisoli]OIJ63119.1 hypothetical protein WN71_035760 [Streptomyces mangrovisoli]